MRFVPRILRDLGALIGVACVLTGCISARELNDGLGTAFTPIYPFPMVMSGGNDLMFCSAAFARKNERWPKDYPELTEFVEKSEGYLELRSYERVNFTQLVDGGVEIAFVPKGAGNEMRISLRPTQKSK